MTKPLHSIRLFYENWADEHRFDELLRLLSKYPCGIDQIALFTSGTHAPLTLEETKRRTAVMRERMKKARAEGFSVGINILATIGHHEEDIENSLKGDYYHMTGADGRICRGSYCMNDVRFLEEYVKPVYRMLAEAAPEFIWVDDDIRYGHLPVGFCCFCDCCIEKFNRTNGTNYTREALVHELNEANMDVRRAWIAKNGSAVVELLRTVGDAVRSVDTGIKLGIMTGCRYMAGYDFKAWADALSDGGRYEIMWRPGGGAYNDIRFDDIVDKAEENARQDSLLPLYVTIVQTELENFPYQLIKKTPTSTALEAAWNMTCGCTGAAFNILIGESLEPLDAIEGHLRAIDRMMPMYRLLSQKTAGMQPSGIMTEWRQDDQAIVPRGDFVKLSPTMFSKCAREMFTFGLPQCYTPSKASVTLITKNTTELMSDEELGGLLGGGVYLDGAAVDFISGRGFGEDIGFKLGRSIDEDARELYCEHPMNLGFAGGIRNCRQAFYYGDSNALLPTADGAQVLSSLIDYHNTKLADCCLGIYENARGGRICASSYYPFGWVSDTFKSEQLRRLMVWLSGERLPSYVDSYVRVHNHTFVSGTRCVAALLNPTNELYENVRVAIRTDAASAVCYHCDGTGLTVSCTERLYGGKYGIFTIDKLPPYEMVLVETE